MQRKHKTTLAFKLAVIMATASLSSCSTLPKPLDEVSSTLNQSTCPGQLSTAHAFLEKDCSACHTAGKGLEAAKCIACHANDTSLLQRMPTAFHATITRCAECHTEHRGKSRRPIVMSHDVLATTGIKMLLKDKDNGKNIDQGADSEIIMIGKKLESCSRSADLAVTMHAVAPTISAAEATLDCSACHKNNDRHQGMFGSDCAACHGTATWSIAAYQHPSPRSMDCAQCHKGPPSHYMGHFKMISQKVAGKPRAAVEQCYRCHQTTSWNDIIDIGWYKHH